MKKKVLVSAVLLVALIAVPTIVSTAKGRKFPPKHDVTFSGAINGQKNMFVDSKGPNWVVAGQNVTLTLSSGFDMCGDQSNGEYPDVTLRIDLNEDKGQAEMVVYYNKVSLPVSGCNEVITGTTCHFEGSGTYVPMVSGYHINLDDAKVTQTMGYTASKNCKRYKATYKPHTIGAGIEFDLTIGDIVE